MDDLDKLAKGLTATQRAFIMALPSDGSFADTAGLIKQAPRNSLRGFGQSGLIEGSYKHYVMHRLTPLGLALRQHIERNEG